MKLLDALQFKNKGRPPVWLMRQAGRYMASYRSLRAKYSFLDLCHQPELVVSVTKLPIDELNPDAAILFSDILMVPEALGFNVQFLEDKGPFIDNHLKTPDEIDSFSFQQKQLSYLPLAIQELKKTISVPLIGFTGAPFTLASYIIEGKTSRDLKKTKKWAYQHPDAFSKIIEKLEDAILHSLKIQHEAGVDALQIFDSWANHLPLAHFEKWCLEPLTRIAKVVSSWEKPLIYFCKGSSYLAPQISKTGVTAISIDSLFPISQIRKNIPGIPLQGNLDPEALYLPKKALVDEVKKILHSMEADAGFIFNLGHGILPDVPYENVRALIETIQSK